MSWFASLQDVNEKKKTLPLHLRWLLWRLNEIMCVKALHILDMAFFPPFSQGIPSMRWLYNLQTLINICILSCGLFPKSQSSAFIWLWIAPPGESSSIYNSVCPVEMVLFLNPHKHSCSVSPSPPAIHAVPHGLVGTWPHHTPTMLRWPYVLSIWQVSPFFLSTLTLSW